MKRPRQKTFSNYFREGWEIPQIRFLMMSLVVFLVICLVIYLLERNGANTQIPSVADAFWWGIVTFTTTGYGDKVPLTLTGRVVASFTMIWGILVMGVVSGSLAGYFVDRQMELRKGKMDLSGLNNHFIICGWKKNMNRVVGGILEFNHSLDPESLVIISNAPESSLEELRSVAEFKGIFLLRGDYYGEEMLRRANPGRAKKIVILADQIEAGSATEADSRTVMTAMILNSHWKGLDICAEVLDHKFDQYLKLANVNDIIYSHEYSTAMLANALSTTGISNIIIDLLDPGTGAMITTCPIPDSYMGLPFASLRDHFKNQAHAGGGNSILIGLLENSGNRYAMRNDALREAQKSPDIGAIVNNLKNVKGLDVNKPNLAPPDDYRIPKNAMAIIVPRKEVPHG